MAAGALRKLLLRYDGKADAPLIAGVPISTDPSRERLAGNEFTYMTPSLAVHIDDPLERVRLTATATAIAKENNQLLGPMLLRVPQTTSGSIRHVRGAWASPSRLLRQKMATMVKTETTLNGVMAATAN